MSEDKSYSKEILGKNVYGSEDYDSAVQSGELSAADVGEERSLKPSTFRSWAKRNIKRRQFEEVEQEECASLDDLFFSEKFFGTVLSGLKNYDNAGAAERAYMKASYACCEHVKERSKKQEGNVYVMIDSVQKSLAGILSSTKNYSTLESQLNSFVSDLRRSD